ncbi:MAG: MlaE family lipid ABC transporter permease subunit [Sideroxyarcus sp.]|nr:MlaE family lipid ABC transporter permease subunit [Sideroxyarcus sp.]
MNPSSIVPAAINQSDPQKIRLAGSWTALGLGAIAPRLDALSASARTGIVIDGAGIEAMDAAGAWVLQKLLQRLQGEGATVEVSALRPEYNKLLTVVRQQVSEQAVSHTVLTIATLSNLQALGQRAEAAAEQTLALLAFIGECFFALLACVAHPSRCRWRPLLFNIRTAGFDALPIVGLLSFMLGIVVAYQGADQLRQYGANIFVADLIGLSMLREFAPLITAIIIAGRSGSAYAAQIGTMAVTEEIDAMRTLGIVPLELLVLPKIFALFIVLPLLTVFADGMGVLGGMLMASVQLDVSYAEFLQRFTKAVSVTAYLTGICKAPVFAFIIAVIGCFQGFRTRGGADSVGRQTTRSVVQAIFLVIVADALFSVAFTALSL